MMWSIACKKRSKIGSFFSIGKEQKTFEINRERYVAKRLTKCIEEAYKRSLKTRAENNANKKLRACLVVVFVMRNKENR